jgi:hypothetical protein
VLAGLDRGHYRVMMVRDLHADGDEVNVRMAGELHRVGEGQRHAVVVCRGIG